MALHEEIRKIRNRTRLTQTRFAKELDISPMHISQIERLRENGGSVPSAKLLKKIALLFGTDEEDHMNIERRLLLELAKAKAPKEISSFFEDASVDKREDKLFYGEAMPPAFVERLKRDAKKSNRIDDNFLKRVDMTELAFSSLIEGNYIINRQKVIAIAKALKQSIEEYLLLADYLPDHLKRLLKNRRGATMLRSFDRLSPEAFDKMLDVVQRMVDMYPEEKERINNVQQGGDKREGT
jgi:transcriptional regulator with XRE-family HTH domain